MSGLSAATLEQTSYPELAQVARAATGAIVDRWTTELKRQVHRAGLLDRSQLRDNLPVTLEQIADALLKVEARPVEQLEDSAESHGSTRFHQDYDLQDLMTEYALLRPIVLAEVGQRLGRSPSIDEAVALNLAIDLSMHHGVLRFDAHKKNQLRASNEAQSKYLSFLSHDLRGGLNGVLLMLEVLRRDLTKEPKFAESLEDLEVMRRSILDTVATMDRFLHAEKFRRGRVQVKPAPVDLDALVKDVAGQFQYQAEEKGLRLELDVQPAARVKSDRELLTLILQNLIGNAVKYTSKGTVRVSVRRSEAPPDSCRVSVADQGPGIPAEKLEGLFAPFTRGETHGQSGSGLGLTIARQAADLLRARLWADSAPGKGTVFHLEVPSQ